METSMNRVPAQVEPVRVGSQEIIQRTTITDIQIPFWRLVGFLIKLSIASIPATIVVSLLVILTLACISALGLIPLAALFNGGSLGQ